MNNTDTTELSEKQLIKQIDRISIDLRNALPVSDPKLKMVIVIPAKNETSTIESTLKAIEEQIDFNNVLFDKSSFEVIILCHNCTDDTFAKGLEFSKSHPETNIHFLELNSDEANTVGAARRVLMNIASERLKIKNGLIITTDADTVPHSHWLFNLSKYLDKEVSLICGLINVNIDGLAPQTQKYLLAKDEYLIWKAKLEHEILPNLHDPWPRHSYNWGPNLAIKKSTHDAIGGIRPLHFLEDVDMYNRVVSDGYLAIHCVNTMVTTSNRIDSRCGEGFGAELRIWTEVEGVPYNVEGIRKLLKRYEIYDLIKRLYSSSSPHLLNTIAELSMMNIDDLNLMYKSCKRYEAMRIQMENYLNTSYVWNEENKNIGVFEACKELSEHFANS